MKGIILNGRLSQPGRRGANWICAGWIVVWLATSSAAQAATLEEVHGFPSVPNPISGLVEAGDGAFYGVTSGSGDFGYGSVFRVTTNGSLTTITSFAYTNGANPIGALVLGDDGALYGVTTRGAAHSSGAVFRVLCDGTMVVLAAFDAGYQVSPSSFPDAVLARGRDGAFYGTLSGGACAGSTLFRVTQAGAMNTVTCLPNLFGVGTLLQAGEGAWYGTANQWVSGYTNFHEVIFRVAANGVVSTLADFKGTNLVIPSARLVKGADGAMYGTTVLGGQGEGGTIFRITPDGDFTSLYEFPREKAGDSTLYPEGAYPAGGLAPGSDGNLFGATLGGGEHGCGNVFRITPGGALTALGGFSCPGGGSESGLVQGSDGFFYGVTLRGGSHTVGSVFRAGMDGSLVQLASFAGAPEGANPQAGLLLASDGDFYGTTLNGGSNSLGAIFRITTNGVLTTLASSDSLYGPAMRQPYGGLMQATDGGLYGTSLSGGTNHRGSVFRVGSDGTMTLFASLDQPNGNYPRARLVQGGDGAFYGTTAQGGSHDLGTVFRVTTNGTLTALVSFAVTNGASPLYELVVGGDGVLYGTTGRGGVGVAGASANRGTVFRLATNGELTTLVSFASTNGDYPNGGLVWGKDGALYGTTSEGGSWPGGGTVFRITTNGEFRTVASFGQLGFPYGRSPKGTLLRTKDGSLYGTTTQGGRYGRGTVFKVDTNGVLTAIASFSQMTGLEPNGGLVQGPDGALYGTTSEGGSRGGGSVFRVNLVDVVRMVSVSGASGMPFTECRFAGKSGEAYQLLRGTNLSAPWESLGTVTIGEDGYGSYTDWSPPPFSAFYRIVAP